MGTAHLQQLGQMRSSDQSRRRVYTCICMEVGEGGTLGPVTLTGGPPIHGHTIQHGCGCTCSDTVGGCVVGQQLVQLCVWLEVHFSQGAATQPS
jgi:hypothetical protein